MRAAVAVVLALACAPALAQFKNNAERDKYIAALVAKINAQTLWIRAAEAVIKDLRCAATIHAQSIRHLADRAAAGQLPDITTHTGVAACDLTSPVPELGPAP